MSVNNMNVTRLKGHGEVKNYKLNGFIERDLFVSLFCFTIRRFFEQLMLFLIFLSFFPDILELDIQ